MPGSSSRAVLTAGILIGLGMGGFVDGILFHQILQLHNMLSNKVLRTDLVNEQINMFWDGLFHAFTWLTTATGIFNLWHSLRSRGTTLSGRNLSGALLSGWGLFNVIEGLIDHQILQLHHVYQNGNHVTWDVAFLLFGVLLLFAGGALMRLPTAKVRYTH